MLLSLLSMITKRSVVLDHKLMEGTDAFLTKKKKNQSVQHQFAPLFILSHSTNNNFIFYFFNFIFPLFEKIEKKSKTFHQTHNS